MRATDIVQIIDSTEPAAFCPRYHHAVELIGRRWSGAILRAMLTGTMRFSDIATAVPGLSDRLLSERLKEFEHEGLVTRTVIPQTPVRVEYRLTEKGRALSPVIDAVSAWAETWVDPVEAQRACSRVRESSSQHKAGCD